MDNNDADYMVAGAVLVTELFAKLVTEVNAAGGKPEDIFRLTQPEGKAILQQVATVIVPRPHTSAEERAKRYWDFPLDELELSPRPHNALERRGIETIGDLVSKSQAEISAFPYFGKKCLKEVLQTLGEHGLELSTQLP